MTQKNSIGNRKLIILMSLILTIQIETFSQNTDILDKVYNSFKAEDGSLNYLQPYLIFDKKNSRIDMVNQIKYQYYSFIHKGDFDILLLSKKRVLDSLVIFETAKMKITDISRSKKILMFNEQHNRPYHRLYVSTFLSDLKKQGYGILALEALKWEDNELNSRKFPISTSGTYTVEPYFANLIRIALELGFEVLPYEDQSSPPGTIESREMAQANNLAKIINSENTKILVLAGFSHISEVPVSSHHDEISYMATRLKEQLGIDPFTIDQTEMSSDARVDKVSIPYKSNEPYILHEFKNRYDLTLVYPNNVDYLHLELGKALVNVKLDEKMVNKNHLIQFYVKTEYENFNDRAIPYEQFLIESKEMKIYLNPQRTYQLVIRDCNYKVLVLRTIDQFKEIIID